MKLFWQKKSSPAEQYAALLERYAGRYLIVHQGFPDEWLESLMKQPGGAGYFRIDTRKPQSKSPSAVEWLCHEHLLPLGLPSPLFVRINEQQCLVRHLTRDGQEWVDSSDLLWFIDELDERHHKRLLWNGEGFDVESGIDVYDNIAQAMFDAITDKLL